LPRARASQHCQHHHLRACRTPQGHNCNQSGERRATLRSESRKMRDGYVVDATKLADMEREFGGRDD
jgi:hypothetical protein